MWLTRLRLTQRQKQRLAERAGLTGRSPSDEIQNAIDLYLLLPFQGKETLRAISNLANCSADRTIRKLDEKISYANCALKLPAKVRKGPIRYAPN
jgi:hypothetical protein